MADCCSFVFFSLCFFQLQTGFGICKQLICMLFFKTTKQAKNYLPAFAIGLILYNLRYQLVGTTNLFNSTGHSFSGGITEIESGVVRIQSRNIGHRHDV